MAMDNRFRASDADREAVVSTLRDAYTAGRLTMAEFDERTGAAYNGKTWGDLRALTDDLPCQPELGADIPGRPLARPRPLPPEPRQPPIPARPRPRRKRHPLAILIPITVWVTLVWHVWQTPAMPDVLAIVLLVTLMVAATRRG
jgi:hypothetical protein